MAFILESFLPEQAFLWMTQITGHACKESLVSFNQLSCLSVIKTDIIVVFQ